MPCSRKHWKQLCGKVGVWKCSADVANFAEEETRQRKASRKTALTKKLDQRQWKELRAHLKTAAAGDKLKPKRLRNLKEMAKAWILYPSMNGKYPEQWNGILAELNSNK